MGADILKKHPHLSTILKLHIQKTATFKHSKYTGIVIFYQIFRQNGTKTVLKILTLHSV